MTVRDSTDLGLSQSDKQALFVTARDSMGAQEFTQMIATAAILPVAEQIIEEATMRKVLQTDRFNTGPAIPYVMKKRATAVVLPRYGAPPMFLTRYTRILVEPYILSHSPEISVIDIRDSNFNMVQDVLEDAGKEMAVMEDSEAFRIFDAVVPVPTGGWPTTTTAITYSAGPGGIGTVLSTNVMQIGSAATAPAGGVAGDPVIQDFLTVTSAMQQIGYVPDVIVTSPYVMGKLAGQSTFLLFLNYGARDVFEKGALSDMLGIKLVTSRLIAQKTMYVLDSKEAARFVERDPISVETSTKNLISTWFMWERVCTFVRNANAIFRIAINS